MAGARPVDRRSALGAGGLGITALALPGAAAATSLTGLGPDGADVAGAYLRSGTVDGVATSYLVLTHTGTVGTSTSYDLTLGSDLTGVAWVVVAGGGAGGANRGGGGGAGGLVIGAPSDGGTPGTLVAGTYRVTVGGGGVAVRISNSEGAFGGDGSDSTVARTGGSPMTLVTAVGGGGGGSRDYGTGDVDERRAGGAGGSSGGSGDYFETPPQSPVMGQGFSGAASSSSAVGVTRRAGGGGGSAGAGGSGPNRRATVAGGGAVPSDGGDGTELTAWCQAARSGGGPAVGEVWDGDLFLAGGGGGFDTPAGCGRAGVGGGGGFAAGKSVADEAGQDGRPHTGGGGGGLQAFYDGGATANPSAGDGQDVGGRAGHGGSGVVMLRWPTSGNATPTVA